jgi:DNA-binding LacI/PurR family transcriptional regulator
MTIAVDFDGVIHGYSEGYKDGSIYDDPVTGVAEAMRKMKEDGHKIYIFTTRTNKLFHKKDQGDQIEGIKAYMKKHDIPYDKIWTFGKPMADVFIDDRAIGFRGDWKETLEDVRNFKVWNR